VWLEIGETTCLHTTSIHRCCWQHLPAVVVQPLPSLRPLILALGLEHMDTAFTNKKCLTMDQGGSTHIHTHNTSALQPVLATLISPTRHPPTAHVTPTTKTHVPVRCRRCLAQTSGHRNPSITITTPQSQGQASNSPPRRNHEKEIQAARKKSRSSKRITSRELMTHSSAYITLYPRSNYHALSTLSALLSSSTPLLSAVITLYPKIWTPQTPYPRVLLLG
jgi:hypothetical protein